MPLSWTRFEFHWRGPCGSVLVPVVADDVFVSSLCAIDTFEPFGVIVLDPVWVCVGGF